MQPTGIGAGNRFKLAPFQRKIIKQLYDSLATFISVPAGNGKTTLMAAVALERLCRGDEYVSIDLVATKEDQARRMLDSMIQMLECAPDLLRYFEFYRHEAILQYQPTGSRVQAHPAKLSAIQGLNFSLALIDEIGFIPPELVTTLLARLGKRDDARVIGFGTPGPDQDNMLETLRARCNAKALPPGVTFIEHSADAGCEIHDRKQWRKANPALRAGFLREEALAVQAATLPEFEFRAYHLGQPIESSGPWLPFDAWDNCFKQEAPPDGSKIVLSMWGNYRRQVAVVGATLDGGIFFGWQGEKPSDGEVETVLRQAAEQWEIVELVHKPHIRVGLMARLEDEGLPVAAWPSDVPTDVDSAAAFYQAIAEQTLAHDHDTFLAEQIGHLSAKVDRKGNPRLVESSEVDVSAALAARAAWWRALALAEADVQEEVVIY